MPKNATISARVDEDLKAKADKVLRRVGVRTSDLITMLLHQVVLTDGIPFDVRVPNKESRRAIAELEAGKGERFKGATADVFDSIVGKRKRRRA